jgi:hypothetical protein
MIRKLAVAFVLCVACGSCIIPSLPVPPPEPGFLIFNIDTTGGTTTFRAAPISDWGGAKVSIYDEVSGHGVITRANADGSVSETAPFSAKDGDRITVQYQLGDQTAGRCLILHDGPSRPDYVCP